MPLWKTLPIEQRPQIVLIRWCIYEVLPTDDMPATRHFVGYNCRDVEGRVSSAITTFDPQTLTGITNSGRIYALSGDSGSDSDARYVWQRWCAMNGVTEFREIGIEELQ